ncbi:prolyl 4-hydroxylase subunit alpha-1-like [Palaemon carinicauda]|uniref:prolyl 4-hydroxylase subunit alpha-1-like n=1 Tax=Palaemon carinicauda TaxID=392227 RepID=UPI0035B62100
MSSFIYKEGQTFAAKMISLFGLLMIFKSVVFEGHGVSGELYSSLAHMDDLFVFDMKVAELLPYLPTSVPEVTSYKESYLCLLQDVMTLAKGNTLDAAITGNPLHLFTVIKRLFLYWPPIKRSIDRILSAESTCEDKSDLCKWWADLLECTKNPTFMIIDCPLSCGVCGKPGANAELHKKLPSLEELERKIMLPSANDLGGASLALARLQQIYRIPIQELATGTIANVTTSVVLSLYDCIRIANESYHEGQYVNAWQWFDYAEVTTFSPGMRDLIKGFKNSIAIEHDKNHVPSNPNFFLHPIAQDTSQVPPDNAYFSLCRGNSMLRDASKTNLKCYISSRGSPYLILRPIKVEQVIHDPELYLFYDVISDKESKVIKDLSSNQLERSKVVTHKDAVELRVSQTAWLRNTSHPSLPTIAKRIAAITGLYVFEDEGNIFAGEQLQTLSYGIGGHYSYHPDVIWKYDLPENWENHREKFPDFESGDRLATWMFYLSDVEAGGRTAFPWAGVSVKPLKGSAVFWYNLKRNGRMNPRSEHGGCPVLLGHKWVANKWIRENINFMRRPCTIDEQE